MIVLAVSIVLLIIFISGYFLFRDKSTDVARMMMKKLPGKLWLVKDQYYLKFDNFTESPRVLQGGIIWGSWSNLEGKVKVTMLDLNKKIVFSKDGVWANYIGKYRGPGVPIKRGMSIVAHDPQMSQSIPKPGEAPFGMNAPIEIILEEHKWFSSPTFRVSTKIHPYTRNYVADGPSYHITPKAVFGNLNGVPMVAV